MTFLFFYFLKQKTNENCWLFPSSLNSCFMCIHIYHVVRFSDNLTPLPPIVIKYGHFIWPTPPLRSISLDLQLGNKRIWQTAVLRSKTTPTSGSVDGPGVDPPPQKINTFFLRSLARSMPIYRHFQSNGVKWRDIKLWNENFM